MWNGQSFCFKIKKIIGITCYVKVQKEYFLVLFLGNQGENQKKVMVRAYSKQK